jgi:hypothetical protein
MIFTAQQEQETGADIKRLNADVHRLTSIYPSRNYKNPASLDQVASYIFGEFNKCSDRVEFMRYNVNGLEYKNVIASFGPGSGERIVVGAHYDVCGDQPGADDNGSGVAALLELARLLSQRKPTLKHPVDLAAYTLEEPPYFRTPYMGSAVHAKTLASANIKIRVMISLDMFGYFSVFSDPDSFVPLYITHGTFMHGKTTAVVGKKGDEEMTKTIASYMNMNAPEKPEVRIVALNLPMDITGIDFSDHLNFWNYRYPAVMISNAYVCPSPNYHKPVDTIDTLDFKKMAYIINGVYRAVTGL